MIIKLSLPLLDSLKNADEILCVDSEKYGPFKEEDIATLPNENAQELISNKIATKIRLEE